MTKSLKITLKILLWLIIVLATAALGFKTWDWIRHFEFYNTAKPFYDTPDIHKGYVPQGFDYVEEENIYLTTGYMSNDEASRVYVMYPNGKTTYTELMKKNGKKYTGHTGGISHYGDYVYITGGDNLDVFSLSVILNGKSQTSLLGTVKTYNNPAYCYVQNGYILSGSYHDPNVSDFSTPEYEHATTPCGDLHKSIITVFKLSNDEPFGVEPTPKAVLSTRNYAQGMCVTDKGNIILSTSHGLSSSQLFVYDTSNLQSENYHFQGTTETGDSFDFPDIQRYYLDSASLVQTIKAPPMSEEILYRDGKILIMNESACNKYLFGKVTSGTKLYAYPYKD